MAEPRTQHSTTIRMNATDFLQLPETTTPTELVEGEVIVSPSPSIDHQIAASNIDTLIKSLVSDGLVLFAPMDVKFDEDNVVQPDVFWISASNQHCKRVENAYWQGPPDLVIEVLSPGSGRRDRRTKFDLYEKHGVREYWIADPTQQLIEVWQFEDNHYQRVGVFGAIDTFTSPVLDKEVVLESIFEE